MKVDMKKMTTFDAYADPSDVMRFLREHFGGKRWSPSEAKSLRDFVDGVLMGEGHRSNHRVADRWRLEDAVLVMTTIARRRGVMAEVDRTVAAVFRAPDKDELVASAEALRHIADRFERLAERLE